VAPRAVLPLERPNNEAKKYLIPSPVMSTGLGARKVGFLGGGAMAGALVKGLVESGRLPAAQIRVSDLKSPRLAELEKAFGIETTVDNAALVR
jgi:hypothetical protein